MVSIGDDGSSGGEVGDGCCGGDSGGGDTGGDIDSGGDTPPAVVVAPPPTSTLSITKGEATPGAGAPALPSPILSTSRILVQPICMRLPCTSRFPSLPTLSRVPSFATPTPAVSMVSRRPTGLRTPSLPACGPARASR